MNEQNLHQFLAATRQYFFAATQANAFAAEQLAGQVH